MSSRTCKIGIHGRNDNGQGWHDLDFQVLRKTRVEAVKMMSNSRPQDFERIKHENPDVEIITRLHDDRIRDGHPSPAEFAERMAPIMKTLQPYCSRFHIANEPNHKDRYEGWGSTDDDARDFNQWFIEAYQRLKNIHPWASIGFPGLALPHFEDAHRDWQWLEICREAIDEADWLGVHCYWQSPPNQSSTIMHDWSGLNFLHYHQVFPDKELNILECGNSNIQNNYPISESHHHAPWADQQSSD